LLTPMLDPARAGFTKTGQPSSSMSSRTRSGCRSQSRGITTTCSPTGRPAPAVASVIASTPSTPLARTASRAIAEGRRLSESMEANDLTTPVAARMLAVAERGGDVGEMLENIATFHDEEMTRWVDWFSRLFEPILMALIGLVIGVIVILMYMPIFELAGSLQ